MDNPQIEIQIVDNSLPDNYYWKKLISMFAMVGLKFEIGGIMRTDIIDYLKNEMYLKCQKPENKFGIGCYYHIEAVAKNAELLADKYGAEL